MPKIFENEFDLLSEQIALKLFISVSKKKLYTIKLPKFELDYLIHDGKEIICFLEIKCNNCGWVSFPYKIISMIKMEKMKKYSHIAPAFIAFMHLDGILAYIDCTKAKGEIKMGGRNSPRDGALNDIEKIMCVNRSLFKTIKRHE